MTALYIGNPTRQVVEFQYRVPEEENFPLRAQRIRPGAQIAVAGPLSAPQVDAIVKQHVNYGLLSVDEAGRSRRFVSLIYSTDKPIPAAKIHAAMEQNQSILVMRGKEFRQQAAVAEAMHLETMLRDNGIPGAVRSVEMAVMEDRPVLGNDMVSEGTRVSRDTNPDGSAIETVRSGRRAKH